MRRHTRSILVVVVLLVFGGTATVAGHPSQMGGEQQSLSIGQATSEQAESETNVTVVTEGFDPDYDPETVLARVEELRDLNAIEDVTLHEYADENESVADVRDQFGAIRPAGARALQLYSNGSTGQRLPLGYTIERDDGVHIYLMNETDVQAYNLSQELVVAHEFVHALQFQHDLISPSRTEFRDDFEMWTTDAILVVTSLIEGDAMTVTEQYRARYGGGENYSVTAYNRTLPRAAWTHSVAGTPYYYGYEFYAAIDADPDVRSAVIRNPPNATAPLLHPAEHVPRKELPPAPDPDLDSNLTGYHTDTVGELVVRHSLRINGLSFPEAADAADGWAGDQMYYYSAPAATATHWVTAWENASEAREFADSWREMLSGLSARATEATTLDDDTLVVPASEEASSVAYVIERDGSTVRVTAASNAELARELAESATESSRSAASNASEERTRISAKNAVSERWW